jgi:hypothetical protein
MNKKVLPPAMRHVSLLPQMTECSSEILVPIAVYQITRPHIQPEISLYTTRHSFLSGAR